MDLTQLRYLCLLAEERHFTRAAARANVAQPALSRQIRKLEEELGIPLVVRTTRRVALTPQGSEIVQHARRALDAVGDIQASADEVRGLQSGRVALGVTHTPGPIDIAAVLGRFQREHPGVDLEVREGFSLDLADDLRDDTIDLAVISAIPVAQRRALQLEQLVAEPLLAVLPVGHALAGRRKVRVAALRGQPVVSFPSGATIRASFEAAAAAAGYAPRVACESSSTARIRELVAEGLGVSVLPRSEVGDELRALPLDPPLTHEVLVATRAARPPAPAATALLRALLSAGSSA
jgi:DNA-binding transcriptional LysR family regulator